MNIDDNSYEQLLAMVDRIDPRHPDSPVHIENLRAFILLSAALTEREQQNLNVRLYFLSLESKRFARPTLAPD